MERYAFQVRVTGILIRDSRLLLVKQRVHEGRDWSLPGGRVEAGETLEGALLREIKEETGLTIQVNRLLYLCDKPDTTPPVLHVSFLLDDMGGDIQCPTNEFDENPIADVQFVALCDLPSYGFSQRFVELVRNHFPGAGHYMGGKENIGL